MTNLDALLTEQPCPHCGRMINAGGLANHRRTCVKLPCDEELAAQYKRLGIIIGLERLYGVGFFGIKHRLQLMGVELIESPAYKAGHEDKQVLHIWRRTFRIPHRRDQCDHCPAGQVCRTMVFELGVACCEKPDQIQVERWRRLGISVADVIQMSGGRLKENGHQ